KAKMFTPASEPEFHGLASVSNFAQTSTNRMRDDVWQTERARHADEIRRLQTDRTFFAIKRKRNVIALRVCVGQQRSADQRPQSLSLFFREVLGNAATYGLRNPAQHR